VSSDALVDHVLTRRARVARFDNSISESENSDHTVSVRRSVSYDSIRKPRMKVAIAGLAICSCWLLYEPPQDITIAAGQPGRSSDRAIEDLFVPRQSAPACGARRDGAARIDHRAFDLLSESNLACARRPAAAMDQLQALHPQAPVLDDDLDHDQTLYLLVTVEILHHQILTPSSVAAPMMPPVTLLSSPMMAFWTVFAGEQHDQIKRVELREARFPDSRSAKIRKT
jgi:hypothetical protein